MSSINLIKSRMQSLFARHLFITNVISVGGLLALGDCIIQNMERKHLQKMTGKDKPYDYRRTGRMLIVGFMLGPFNHYWYKFLDKYVTGSGFKIVAKKIAADQAVAGPFFCSSFLFGSSIVEGKSLREFGEEWKEKFITIYMVDWCVWPPAQFINFYFLPPRFRVVYVSMVTLLWNTFLCFMKHKDEHYRHLQKLQEEMRAIKSEHLSQG